MAGNVLYSAVMETKPEPPLGKRILLVDDERSVRDTIRHLLRFDDHTVTEANNGAEALGLFAQNRFDVVLTDCVMPFVKGTELAVRIKKLAPDQPILMITGHGLKPGLHNPVDAVLRKPFDLGALRTALAGVL
jgi:two-component system, NtrC family, nitrogen regulation response regulator NtrX